MSFCKTLFIGKMQGYLKHFTLLMSVHMWQWIRPLRWEILGSRDRRVSVITRHPDTVSVWRIDSKQLSQLLFRVQSSFHISLCHHLCHLFWSRLLSLSGGKSSWPCLLIKVWPDIWLKAMPDLVNQRNHYCVSASIGKKLFTWQMTLIDSDPDRGTYSPNDAKLIWVSGKI